MCLHPFSDTSDAWGGLGPFIVDDMTKCVDMSDAELVLIQLGGASYASRNICDVSLTVR